MKTNTHILTIVLVIIGLNAIYSQSKATFGLQYKPILPIKALNVTDLELSENRMNVTLSPQLGLNFGAMIRWELLDKLSLETALNYNKRNFRMEAMLEDTAVSGSLNYSVITYEVPIQALFYVRFSKQWYMNVASGFSINFRASNVGKLSEDENPPLFFGEIASYSLSSLELQQKSFYLRRSMEPSRRCLQFSN